jgi:hypothetical protein
MGDALINLPQTGFVFLPDKYCHDPVTAKTSLEILLSLEIEIMTFAHGPAITLNAKEKLGELLGKKISVPI